MHDNAAGLAHDWNDRTIKSNRERFDYLGSGSKSSLRTKLRGEFMPEYHERQRKIVEAMVLDKKPNDKDD